MEPNPSTLNPEQREQLIVALRHTFLGLGLTGLLWGQFIRIPILDQVDFPPAFLSALWMLWGFYLFTEVDLGRTFAWRAKWTLRAAFMVLYFLPIIHWWTSVLGSYFYAVNGAFFVLVVIALITLSNLLCADIMRQEEERAMASEFRLSAFLCAGMLLFITLFVMGLVISFVVRHQGLPFKEIRLSGPTIYSQLMAFLPVLLTLVSFFKTHHVLQTKRRSAVETTSNKAPVHDVSPSPRRAMVP